MIRPRALRATLGLLLAPLAAHACPEPSLSCIPRRHVALTQESGAGVLATRGESSLSTIGLGLGADFFPRDNLSVGMTGGVFAYHRDRAESRGGPIRWQVAWTVGVRAGYNIPIARRWSFWPRLGVGFENVPRTGPASGPFQFNAPQLTTVVYRTVSLEAFAPLVLHPNAHFFVGFGPHGALPVFAYANGTSNPLTEATFGARLLLGGHF